MKKPILLLLLAAAMFLGACKSKQESTVSFYGWGGDQSINQWIDTILAPTLKQKYDINLVRVPMDIGDILSKLTGEKQAGVKSGDIDVVWINGENFYIAKTAGLLYGPITDKIDNYARYIDSYAPDSRFDFGVAIEGMEVPYGKAQLVFIADSAVLGSFPGGTGELLELAKRYPGRLTYPAPPNFTGSAFVRNIISDIVGYDAFFNAPSDEQGLYAVIKPALDYLIELKPYLWQQGETYPRDNIALDMMYANGQALMTMNYTPFHAAQRIADGQFPPTSRTFAFDRGNIGNTHYVAVPYNAPHKDAALVLINHIISAEMQISKYDTRNWGDLPVFDTNRLNDAEKKLLDSVDNGIGILSPAELQEKRIPEVQAEKVPVIDKLWYRAILE